MYIDWATKIIHVLKTDSFMSLVQSTPTIIYDCSLNGFRLGLKDIEDSSDGMAFLRTHKHNTEVALGGLTFARVIEIINDYTITFEDGQYAVNLVGANTNIADKVNVNQVSIRPQNSAGLISSPDIEYASFQSGVWIDTVTGDDLNKGNEQYPVQTIDRALLVASYRGFKKLYAQSNITIGTGHNFDDFIIQGQSHVVTKLTIEAGASCERLTVDNCNVGGVLDGDSEIRNCIVGDIVYFNGHIHNSGLYGMFYLDGANYAVIADCSTLYIDDPPIIDMGGSEQSLSMPNYSGLVTIQNFDSDTDSVGIGLNAGMVFIDSTVIDGELIISGTGTLSHTQTGSEEVNFDGLLNKNAVGVAVWDEPISNHLISGTTGRSIGVSQFGGKVYVSSTGTSGTVFPIGTDRVPVDNMIDAITIATNNGLDKFHIENDFTITGGTYSAIIFEGLGRKSPTLTFDGTTLNGVQFSKIVVTGEVTSGSSIATDFCTVIDFEGAIIHAYETVFDGTIKLSAGESNFYTCTDGVPGVGIPDIHVLGCDSLGIWNWDGGIRISNISTINTVITCMIAQGRLWVDSTCVEGNIIVKGLADLRGVTGGTTIDSDGLITKDKIEGFIWGYDRDA